MHNYRSNQSALMTRCGTDFRHQYGIFCGESQTYFTQNATRAGSEEGRLFSQANNLGTCKIYVAGDARIGHNKKPIYVKVMCNHTLIRWVSNGISVVV